MIALFTAASWVADRCVGGFFGWFVLPQDPPETETIEIAAGNAQVADD